ncbi:isopenicillin N synthase family dioxygenase [Planktotalea sp.]|uniref:isopenicillin N synthase family dioxygenase n=1 Tax=Planktotalea sp. TaxID=2029877 RepID=UPI003D6C026C
MTAIPVLDLTDRNIDRAFVKAYSNVGFAYFVGHGICPKLRQSLFDVSKVFHALPESEKNKVAVDRNHRGYIGMASSTDVNSTLAEVNKPNQSASFMMMREDAIADRDVYLSGPNQWPDVAQFRDTLERYNQEMCVLADKMMRIALRAIGAPVEAIEMFTPPTTWLRLLHYPPMPHASPDDLYGSAPHTDFGALTFLATDDVGGLQVQTPDGREWIDVPPRQDAFVVNVGDMLHRLSNGALRSTPHRVINKTGRERYSCPFFYDPHVSATIKPLIGAQTPAFEPMVFGHFLRRELEASYDAHKPDMDQKT